MYKTASLLLVTFAFTGCAANDPNANMKGGAAIGAASGAVIGQVLDSSGGGLKGAVIGGIAGAVAGGYMDNQKKEMDEALRKEQEANAIKVEQLENETLKIDIASEVSFDFDSAAIKPTFAPTLDKVADVLQRYPKTVIHVVGHTDSVGSESYNQTLSEQRARSVADYFAGFGISSDRLKAEGRGELEPRASNETETGRQLNRRVEIYVKPIVEGKEAEAYQTP